MNEIYEDVLKEEPKEIKSKEYKKWEKRLFNSIGWLEPEIEYSCKCDEKGRTWEGAEREPELVWEVNLRNGIGFTCEKQIEAELLSYLVQINERLKRMEDKLKCR